MNIEVFRQTVEQAGLASAGIGFMASLLFSLNPVAVAAFPVSLAYVTRAREKRTAVAFGAMFIFGLIVTHVLLGLAAGFGEQWVERLFGRYWGDCLWPVAYRVRTGLGWMDPTIVACCRFSSQARHRHVGRICAGNTVFSCRLSGLHTGFNCVDRRSRRYRLAAIGRGRTAGLCSGAFDPHRFRCRCDWLAGGIKAFGQLSTPIRNR